MAKRRQPAVWEFPGAFAILGALGLFTLIWPWLVLDGTAKVVVGLLWTALAALIGAGVIRGRQQVRYRRGWQQGRYHTGQQPGDAAK